MRTTRVKTKYQGLVWVHQKYVNAVKRGETLYIEHDGMTMTVTPEKYKEQPARKAEKPHEERYGPRKGKEYFLYGFKFIPDGMTEKQAEEPGLLAQCPTCLSCKLNVKDGKKMKVVWQQSIVSFPNAEREQCYPCKSKEGVL